MKKINKSSSKLWWFFTLGIGLLGVYLFYIFFMVSRVFESAKVSPSVITVQTERGKQVMYRNIPFKDTQVPQDIPKDLPIYPHLSGTIDYASGTEEPGISAESIDNIKTINSWFVEQLPKNNWTIIDDSYDASWKRYDILIENPFYTGHITITNRDNKNNATVTSTVRIHEYVKKKQ